MASAQLNFLARQLMEKLRCMDEDVKKFCSHSCKTTMLSWAAKAGLPMEDRRLLGGHSNPGEKMTLEYSRDALAGPLLRLEEVVRAVRKGEFRPDSTRSGRWAKSSGRSLAKRARLADAPSAKSSSSESSSGERSSSDSSSASGDDIEGLAAIVEESKPEVFDGYAAFHNMDTLKRHMALPDEDIVLCGLWCVTLRPGAASFMSRCKNCLRIAAKRETMRGASASSQHGR